MKKLPASILRNIIHPAVALGLTLSAFAGGKGPVITTGPVERGPDIKVPRPDLVPLGFTATRNEEEDDDWFRMYSAKVTVANWGTAKSSHFRCIFGYKVLATNDPEKYPVGFKQRTGLMLSFSEGLDILEVADESHATAFFVPKSVTKFEVYLLVDRYLFGVEDDWETDSGEILEGRVVESNELNNVWGPKVYNFIQLPNNPPDVSR